MSRQFDDFSMMNAADPWDRDMLVSPRAYNIANTPRPHDQDLHSTDSRQHPTFFDSAPVTTTFDSTYQGQENVIYAPNTIQPAPPNSQVYAPVHYPFTQEPKLPPLPQDYTTRGWEQHFSTRYNQPFFFNRMSLQSVWMLPQILDRPRSPEYPPFTHGRTSDDILRLNGPAPTIIEIGAPTVHYQTEVTVPVATNNLQGSREPFGSSPKRAKLHGNSITQTAIDTPAQHSQPLQNGHQNDTPPQKLSEPPPDPWDFSIKPAVKCYKSSLHYHTFKETMPLFEIYRSKELSKLRQCYDELCYKAEQIKSPDESFSRWVCERKLDEKLTDSIDPIVPVCEGLAYSQSMFQDIIRDIPLSWKIFHDVSQAGRNLFQYAHFSQKLAEERAAPGNADRRAIMEACKDELHWLRYKCHFNVAEDCHLRLIRLRRKIYEHIINILKPRVEGICRTMDVKATECARRLKSLTHGHVNEYQPVSVNGDDIEVVMSAARVVANTAQKRAKSMTAVSASFEERNLVILVLDDGGAENTVKINKVYYRKVKELYKHYNKSFKVGTFHRRLWCVLRRYQTIFGTNTFEEQIYQGALPVRVYKVLHEVFGVTMECFASPLNSYFKHYCSMYPDTDAFFGSSGSMLNLDFSSGSFQANPPFSFQLMEAMVDHFEKLLTRAENAKRALSFIIFLPEYTHPIPLTQLRIEVSSFLREKMLIPAHEHKYRSGLEYIDEEDITEGNDGEEVPQKSMLLTCSHGTFIFFLQTSLAYEKWKPTSEKQDKLLAAFCDK